MAILLKADGTMSEVKLAEGDGQLAQLQQLVGGFIERVKPRGLPPHLAMICNQEGLLRELPANLMATAFYWFGLNEDDVRARNATPVCGDVVIVLEQTVISEEGERDIRWS
jgi:hypothetical protein